MNLRAFHIVFITFCTLLFGFLTAWALWVAPDRSPMAITFGAIGVAGLLGMPFYGVYFYRKAKKLVL
jgi:hypothetical protein